MTIDDKIRDQKMQYDINSEAAKVSAISYRKICKYEYLTSEEILPYNQIQIIQQATYSTLGKAFEKQTKTICDHGKKQIKKLKIMESNWLNLMKLLGKILISTDTA